MTGCAAAIDLGGTQLRAALVDRDGRVLNRAACRTAVAGGPEAVLQQIGALLAEICGPGGTAQLASIGICAPGPLDSTTGVVLGIPTLPGWKDFPLKARIESAFNRPTLVENDGVAAANGEWRHGAGRGHSNLVYVTVSTGIGGGVVVDGRLLHGRRGMAGHVGHMRIAADGPRCSCGAIGCFEALASGSALGQAGRRAAAADPAGLLASLAAGEPVDAGHVAEAARRGDPVARALMDAEAEQLGRGFTSLIHLFSPDLVIMGGGVAQAFDLLDESIHAVIRRDALAPFKDVQVVPAALGQNAGLVGVAALAMQAMATGAGNVDAPPGRG